MKMVREASKVMMVTDDGRINAPFSFFLNTHKNPNTQESLAGSLKLFHGFLLHFKISLVDRALEGRCLDEREVLGLINLSFRPLTDLADPRRIARLVDVRNAEPDEDRDNAVKGGTVEQRLKDIAAFLKEYQTLVSNYIRSADTRERLSVAYQACCERLRRAVGGAAASSSAYDFRSMTSTDFVGCMKVVYSRPKVLLGEAKSDMHLLRDRAMFMLSCEGLRPGEICNLRVNDLVEGPNGLLSLQVAVNKKHRKVVKSSTPLPKGASSNIPYATVRMIHLWPFTRDALDDYINGPRSKAIAQSGEDRTSGFVFIKTTGDPVASRQAVSLRFSQMCDALHQAGHMKIDAPPRRGDSKKKELSSYTMRHSAASYFYASKMQEFENKESVFDLMKARFGWTGKSHMPEHYAKRGIVDIATVQVNDIYTQMRAEVDRMVHRNDKTKTHRNE